MVDGSGVIAVVFCRDVPTGISLQSIKKLSYMYLVMPLFDVFQVLQLPIEYNDTLVLVADKPDRGY
jgi:hypothetical protein